MWITGTLLVSHCVWLLLSSARVKITFPTLRHLTATMEYHKTRGILDAHQRLGHRSIVSTMIYTHMVNFDSDDYHVVVAKTMKEDEDLIKAGFEYVTEREDMKIYRKRK